MPAFLKVDWNLCSDIISTFIRDDNIGLRWETYISPKRIPIHAVEKYIINDCFEWNL